MSEIDNSILIDWYVGLDFCKTHIPECDLTRDILRRLHSYGVSIEIRTKCWRKIIDSLGNIQLLLEHLTDRASDLLSEYSEETALTKFKSNVLERSELTDNLGIDPKYLPEPARLKSDVEEMGLRTFRRYTDNGLSMSISAQSELDLLISSKYSPSSKDPFIFEASMNKIMDSDEQVDLLLDAHVWSDTNGSYLLTRKGNKIYCEKSAIEEKMNRSKYKILSPEDINKKI